MEPVDASADAAFHIASARDVDEQQWDAFVQSHPDRALPHLRGFRQLIVGWKAQEDHSVVALDNNRQIVAALPLFTTERRVLRLFTERSLVSTPMSGNGPLLAVALSLDERQRVLAQLEAHVRTLARSLGATRAAIVYPVFAGSQSLLRRHRYHPLKPFGWNELLQPMLVVDLQLGEAELFKSFRSTTRSVIRQAMRAGAICRPVSDGDEWMSFYEANRLTQGEAALTREGMRIAWDAVIEPGHALALCVEQDGEPVCAVVVSLVNGVAYYLLSFNSPPARDLGANRLALWEAMREAKRRGLQWFEFGPRFWGSGKEATIAEFKAGFGGEVWYQSNAQLDTAPIRGAALELAAQSYRAVSTLGQRRPQQRL